jgi:transcriptional regulator with XRE-family HTH domain
MNKELAERLRVERAARGWSLKEAAERCGIQRDTLSALEHAKRGVYSVTLERIAAGYGVPIAVLLGPGGSGEGNEGSVEWALTADDADFLRWVKIAKSDYLHALWNSLLSDDVGLREPSEATKEVVRDRSQVLIEEFFSRKANPPSSFTFHREDPGEETKAS